MNIRSGDPDEKRIFQLRTWRQATMPTGAGAQPSYDGYIIRKGERTQPRAIAK